MTSEIDELTQLAYEGGEPLTTTPTVGTPGRPYASVLEPGAEPVGAGEIRVTVLGSGDPFVKKSQASASLLIEVGNEQRDFFFFDLGSGALANFQRSAPPRDRDDEGVPHASARRSRGRHADAGVESRQGRAP